MDALCMGCGRPASGCLALLDGCRYRLLLAATRKLLIDGTDPTKGSRTRERHRALARKRMRAIIEAEGASAAGPVAVAARESWPRWAREIEAAIRLLLLAVVVAAAGCGEGLSDPCAPIPDGTYTAPVGDTYTFAGGQPTGDWSCVPTATCPGRISCTPISETVYTVEFVNDGDGTIEATTSPPDRTVTLTKGGL